MSHRTGSLKYQVNQIFARGHAIGESKHAAKREGDPDGRVFAVRTDWNYRDGALYFARWARERHGCHDVAAALRRPHWGREWADALAAEGKAASTRKAYVSGVAKACAIVAPSLRSAWTEVISSIGRRTPPPPRGYGSDAERVLAAVGEASPEAMLILELALATGARIGELVRTRRGGDHHLVSDRLLDARGLLLVGKGGLQRLVHVPEALYARLETLADGKRDEESLFTLVDRDVQRELRVACHRLGLPPTGPHGLRYDFAARLRARLMADGWAADAADRQVSLQLGHRRPAITHHYLRGA
jgi:integrase